MKIIRPQTFALVLVLIGAAVLADLPAASSSPAPVQWQGSVRPAGSDLEVADIKPTSNHEEVARNLFRTFVIHLENYARRPEGAQAPEVGKFAGFMARLPAQARNSLINGARKFTAQNPKKLRQFYGKFYAPTPEERLKSVPQLTAFLRERKALFLRPRPLMKPGQPAPAIKFPALPLEELGLGGVLLYEPQKQFSAPKTLRLELELSAIKVIKQNDDDTPEDEIYLGVVTIPGHGELKRYPAGDSYWQIREGDSKVLNLKLATFDRIQPGDVFSSYISVFEYDDGTWGEIWSAMVQVAEYAFEAWLDAEIGTVMTEVVMYFLDDVWDWVAGWFQNPDDYISTIAVQRTLEHEPKFWPPGGSIPSIVTRYPEGADAKYRFDLRWVLSRVTLAR